MRYNNLAAFQKHLHNAHPNHLSYAYLILSPNDYERKMAIDAVLAFLPKNNLRRFSGDLELSEVLAELYAPSLFDEKAMLVIDSSKEIKKKESDLIAAYFARPERHCQIILGFPSRQNLSALYPIFEKEGVIFDLLEEKKWDKEQRLMDRAQEKVRMMGKTITSEAAAEFFSRLDKEMATFDQEVDKLLLYVGERKQITKQDVLAICSSTHTFTLWQTAEALVWRGSLPGPEHCDATNFHALCSFIRAELRIGYKVKSLLEGGCRLQDLPSHFPGVWPKTLEKKREAAEKKTAQYFKNGLLKLFQIEFLSKNGITSYELLMTSFGASLC